MLEAACQKQGKRRCGFDLLGSNSREASKSVSAESTHRGFGPNTQELSRPASDDCWKELTARNACSACGNGQKLYNSDYPVRLVFIAKELVEQYRPLFAEGFMNRSINHAYLWNM